VECFLVGVGNLADGELARRLLQQLSGVVDEQVVGDPIVRNCHIVSNRAVALNRHVIVNQLLQRLHPSASFWGPVSSLKAWTVVVVPGLTLGL